MTYTFYSDPGHGWLAVPISDLQMYGLTPADFSQYSYRHYDTVFLEEDIDALVFIDAFAERMGSRPEIRELHTDNDSPIRTYRRIK